MFQNYVSQMTVLWLFSSQPNFCDFCLSRLVAGLLNATFGNAVEMIISVFALREGLTEASWPRPIAMNLPMG